MAPNNSNSLEKLDTTDFSDEKDNIIELKKTAVSTEEHFIDTETYQISDKNNTDIAILDDQNFEDGEVPTQEEMDTLRHVSGHIPFRCWLIALVELSERFSYYGLSAPFQNYMSNGPDDSPKGLLQLDSSGATGLSYFFQFWCYITPIFGGYMADTYWGKYNTIAVGTGIYLVGIFILFITSIPSITDKNTGLGGFIASIILIGIATGMIKANLSVLIADQLPKRKPTVKTLKSGERVIEDPNITLQNVFMFFYLMINVGSLSVIATTELESHKGFWAAYLLPFCFFWVAVVVLVFGRKQYIRPPIGDKVISKCFKVLWILIRNKFNFDLAKPSINPEKNYPWSDKFVDEIKVSLAACKVFLFYPIYWTCYGQMISTFVTQGSMLELHGLPNDFFQAIDSIALIVFIPIFEGFLYPFIRRFTPFKPITKIFWGFTFGALAMTWSCVLQHFIYSAGPCYDHPLSCSGPNHVHVGWQVPAYVLIAFSEIFASITGLEYAYSKAPDSMKSFIMSIFLVTNAFGSAIGCALSPVSKDPDYTWLFGGLAVACFIAGCLFWLCFRSYNDTIDAQKLVDDEEEIERNNQDIEMLESVESDRDERSL
ncbi:similar to Saccharomyces cerevisiae YKR093W PTR2 Integral membrane peptide transporter, mediates transport of di-and tri-peptides [Maudiozyma saulgeensis]|uniref:Similar to Saccharomyces cerevisiae YKR093W PTR2 Integral membrane peptide transporter, mediates transport of di-and tri-peptides n=1 Tax=Maudiozyma saulgeensis TaxID=1789683 RepID=A0A1X7RA12_9SACH|nr:similar to Saccharomyces cerevisiae YKR093W PTR2 Integral membrane peptide transporter, mediates transport of di-and tri-peptides [Kazachstania saulgeensis]